MSTSPLFTELSRGNNMIINKEMLQVLFPCFACFKLLIKSELLRFDLILESSLALYLGTGLPSQARVFNYGLVFLGQGILLLRCLSSVKEEAHGLG